MCFFYFSDITLPLLIPYASSRHSMSELKEIHELNNFCLLNIFKKLNYQDLYSMAFSCKRFLDIAQMAFESNFETFERVDEKILRVFGNKILNVTIKLRMYEEPPQFSKQNVLTTYKHLKTYCANLKTCKIMLAKIYNDFKIDSDNINWYNGFLATSHKPDSNVFININCEQELNVFIEAFTNYLNRDADIAYGYGNFANGNNLYEEFHNRSDLVKSFPLSLYDVASEEQIRVIGQNLTNVQIELTEYNFDLKMPNSAIDQYEAVRIVQKHCPNIKTLKIQIVDVNIFRRESFQKLLRKTTKLKLSLLNETIGNFDDIQKCIQNLMDSCNQLKSLTLHVSKCNYLQPFLNASYQNIKKVTIVSSELYNNDLITAFRNVNGTVNELYLLSKIIEK
jgi:hypothetical protein